MKQLQHSVFLNLSRVSKYQERSRYLTQPRNHFAKFREDQIRNEFQLVDFSGSGRLSRQQIKNYLAEKYQKVNFQLLDNVLSTMKWDEQDHVEKEQFCKKYLQRQKYLYHQLSAASSLKQRLATKREIFQQTKLYKPNLYALIKISKLFIKSDREGKETQEWMDIQIQYEDHKNKFNYLIQQPSYGTEEPSFQVLLPAQENYFFVKYRFFSAKGKQIMYGQCYVNIPVVQDNKLKKYQKVVVDVTNINNQKKGYCEFIIDFQPNIKTVEQKLEEMQKKQPSMGEQSQILKKQYEYLQYLWGVRHKYPHKINNLDVKWMIVVRIILILVIGITSIIVQVLGRCQPLSFILALILVKNWKYVMLRSEKFLLSWISIAAICLDLIWIAFGADQISQINYLQLAWCSVLTYLLIIAKILLLLYLVIVQKSFENDEQNEVVQT